MWVCGLKHQTRLFPSGTYVAPYVGVWIETYNIHMPTDWISRTLCGCVDWNDHGGEPCILRRVAPYVGVWIETVRLYT